MKNLEKYYLDSSLISNDLYGKNSAIHELNEIKSDIKISVIKIGLVIIVLLTPVLLVALMIFMGLYDKTGFLGAVFVSLIAGALGGGIISSILSLLVLPDFKDENGEDTDMYQEEKKKIILLWQRRKKLNRFLHVDSEIYENSQARDIAPLLLARIKKHNTMVAESKNLINLQRTLDINSEIKRADALEKTITSKIMREHKDLMSRLETYEVMKNMKSDISDGLTQSLMPVFDFNKSDLDDFLNQKQESISILLEEDEDHSFPS